MGHRHFFNFADHQQPNLLGFRLSDALALFPPPAGKSVHLSKTCPPVSRPASRVPDKGRSAEPPQWRVIRQRLRGDTVELVVTPEWLPLRTAPPSADQQVSHSPIADDSLQVR